MQRLFDFLFSYAEPRWREPFFGACVAVASFAVPFLAMMAGADGTAVSTKALIASAFGIVAAFGWWTVSRAPKVRSGRKGIVVAIRGDDTAHEQFVRADFVQRLRDLVHELRENHHLELIEYPSDLAKRIVDQEDAIRELRQANGSLVIWGQAKRRSVNNQVRHVLELRAAVLHAPIPVVVSDALSKEMTSVWPSLVDLADDGAVYAFKVAADHIDASARYVLGLAAYASGEFASGESILLDARARAERLVPPTPVHRQTSVALLRLYRGWANTELANYNQTRESSRVVTARRALEKALEIDPTDYGTLLMLAFCVFETDRDTATAKRLLRRCKDSPDLAWRFSEAFLSAYEGRTCKAIEQYRAAAGRGEIDPEVGRQIHEHIQAVLRAEPERIELHAAAAMSGHVILRDPHPAMEHLRLFRELCPQERQATEVLRLEEALSRPPGGSTSNRKKLIRTGKRR